jgi:broad specificity phosphatase PhoE
MTRLAMIRHAPTTWNEAGRIQGQTDTPLSDAGKQMVTGWTVPHSWKTWDVVTSPLQRTRDTAQLLGLAHGRSDERLIEMDWGSWAGETLPELRSRGGQAMTANEARGIDFRPQDGESPRDVAKRLALFLDGVAALQRNTLVVTHRGVMRAALTLATNWDMTGPPPLKLPRDGALMLELSRSKAPTLGEPAMRRLGPRT